MKRVDASQLSDDDIRCLYTETMPDIYLHYYLCAVITLFVLRQCHRVVEGATDAVSTRTQTHTNVTFISTHMHY